MFKISTCTLLFGIAVMVASILFNPLTAQTTIQIDTTFGDSGFTLPDTFQNTSSLDVAVQPDGKIVGLSWKEGGNLQMILYRFNSDGSLDTSFADNGMLDHDFKERELFRNVFVTSSNKILVSGLCRFRVPINPGSTDSTDSDTGFVLQFLPNGIIDTQFANKGVLQLFDDRVSNLRKIIETRDNKLLLLGGFRADSGGFVGVCARMDTLGRLDTSFADSGIYYDSLSYSGYNDVIEDAEGRIVIGGSIGNFITGPERADFRVIRLLSNGTIDRSFGMKGIWRTPILSRDDVGVSLAEMNNSNILLAGYVIDKPGDFDFAYAIFSDNEIVKTQVVHVPGVGTCGKVMQYGNDFYLVGHLEENNIYNIAFAKLNSLGEIDSSFGENGVSQLEKPFDENVSLFFGSATYNHQSIFAFGDFSIRSPSISTSFMVKYFFTDDISQISDFDAYPLLLFPNPTQEYLNIRSKATELLNIRVFDLLGKEQSITLVENKTINVASLKTGTYYIQASSKNQFFKSAFVKQ